MSAERMITEALLVDKFSGPLHRLAGEQDAYARKTNSLNVGGNLLIGSGSALLAFGVKATRTAGIFDQIKKSMIATVGASQAAYDTKYVDAFAQHSSQTYLNLSLAAGKLDAQHVSVSGHLQDMADIAAGTGASVGELSQIYDRLLAGGKTGTALGQQGFPRFGFSTKEIFEEAGLPYRPGQKVQGMITPEQADAAIHKLIQKKGWHGLDTKQATTTIKGASSMLEDAVTRFEKGVGDANLGATITLLNNLAGSINSAATAMENHPTLTKAVEVGAGGTLLVGGILKSVAAWREYKAIVGAVKIAGDAERLGEAAKPAIAGREAQAVKGAADEYFMLGGKLRSVKEGQAAEAGEAVKATGKLAALRTALSGVGTAATAGTAAEGAFSSALVAGAVTVGAYAVALAGLLVIGYEVVSMFKDAGDASTAFEASTAAVNKARAEGYDMKDDAGRAQGFNALPAWKQALSGFGHSGWGAALNPALAIYGALLPDADTMGSAAISDKASTALARKHGRPVNGVTATMLREQQAQREAAAQARRDAAREAAAAKAASAGSAANGYELDPALDYKLKQDERRVALLKEMGGHEKELKAARAGEIADLNTAAGLLERQAGLATDVKKKYDLLDQAAEDRQKAKMLALDKSDQRDKLDKAVATVLGGGGVSEDEILKRAGIGRAFFGGLGKNRPPGNPLAAALTQAAKRPLLVQVQIGDRTWLELKKEITDDVLLRQAQIARAGGRNTLFGSTN